MADFVYDLAGFVIEGIVVHLYGEIIVNTCNGLPEQSIKLPIDQGA